MSKIVSVCVILCIAGFVAMSCTQKPRTGPFYKGRELEKQGEYLEAKAHYDTMSDPDMRDVSQHNLQHLYGDILENMIAQQQDPDSPEINYELGKAYYKKALSIPEGVEIAPNQGLDTNAYFAEQRAQFQTRAHTALERATQQPPQFRIMADGTSEGVPASQQSYQDALAMKARLYEDMQQPENAITAYKQLIDRQTASAETYYRLGLLLYNQGQHQEGLGFVQQATIKFPESADAHFAAGILYAREEAGQQALGAFHQTLCLNPYYADAYYRISQIYLDQNSFIDAERVLREGSLKNSQAEQVNLFYHSLKSILDTKFLDEFVAIYKELAGEVLDRLALDALKGQDFEPSPALEIRYYRLLIDMVNRRRPYVLPCSGEKEHPYFARQITLIEEKIEKAKQAIKEAEEAAAAEAAAAAEEAAAEEAAAEEEAAAATTE